MAGIRTYITLSEDDTALLQHYGVLTRQCRGQAAAQLVLQGLYRSTQQLREMRAKQVELVEARRQAVINYGR